MLKTYEQNGKTKLLATVLSIVIIAGIVVIADQLKAKKLEHSSRRSISAVVTPVSTNTSGSTKANTTAGYKDGTYSATSNYVVPHGQEQIQVSVTLKNGTISNASIQNSKNDFDSASFQEGFASAYKSYVVGQKISGLQLSNVAGASDTTQGFNDALNQIANQAQA